MTSPRGHAPPLFSLALALAALAGCSSSTPDTAPPDSGVTADAATHLDAALDAGDAGDAASTGCPGVVSAGACWTTTSIAAAPHLRRTGVTTRLGDGRVLYVGGSNDVGDDLLPVDVYDPSSDSWSDGGALPAGLLYARAAALGATDALASSHCGGCGGLYRYTAASRTWAPLAPPPDVPPYAVSMAPLPNGDALVVFQNSISALSLEGGWGVVAPDGTWLRHGSFPAFTTLVTPEMQLVPAGGVVFSIGDGPGGLTYGSVGTFDPRSDAWNDLVGSSELYAASALPGTNDVLVPASGTEVSLLRLSAPGSASAIPLSSSGLLDVPREVIAVDDRRALLTTLDATLTVLDLMTEERTTIDLLPLLQAQSIVLGPGEVLDFYLARRIRVTPM